MDDLCAQQYHFVRAEQVAAAGLKRGLAIPMESLRTADRHVVTFLAGSQLPLAKRIERWVPDGAKTRLNCVYAYSEQLGTTMLMEDTPLSLPLPTAGSVATALTQGIPTINTPPPAEDTGAPGVTAGSIEATALIAIPVVCDGEVVEVVVLYL